MALPSAVTRAIEILRASIGAAESGRYETAIGAARVAVRLLSSERLPGMDSDGFAFEGVEVACSARPVRTLADMTAEEIAEIERRHAEPAVRRA